MAANPTELEHEFRAYVEDERNRALGVNGSSADVSCPFIPFHVLQDYWTQDRIVGLLNENNLHAPLWSTIQKKYLRVFSTLAVIGQSSWIGWFVKRPHCDDAYLPFYPLKYPPPFLRDVAIFPEFHQAQWQFCPQKFNAEELERDQKFEPEQILPIIEKQKLPGGQGASGTTWLVTLHDQYNFLVNRDQRDTPIVKRFVLKTYTSGHGKAQKYYEKEVKNFKELMRSEKVEENIITFYGSWRQADTFNILLEHADGGTLLDYFNTIKPPTEGSNILELWTSLLAVVGALVRIHELANPSYGREVLQGIHQDVKPSNILVFRKNTNNPYDVVFKLADLDLSHFTAVAKGTDSDSIDRYGSLTYSAPECCRLTRILERSDLPVKPNIDIWSLGCVFSEALVWAVFGKDEIEEYRKLRNSEIKQELRGAGYGSCFHNGNQVLNAVKAMHRKARENCRKNDHVTERLVDMIERMLQPCNTRLSAVQVHMEWHQQILWHAQEKIFQIPPAFQVLPQEPPTDPPLPSESPATPPQSPKKDPFGIDMGDTPPPVNPLLPTAPLPHPGTHNLQALSPVPKVDVMGGRYSTGDMHFPVVSLPNPPQLRLSSKRPFASYQDVHMWRTKRKDNLPAQLQGEEFAPRLDGRDHVFLVDDSESMRDHWAAVQDVFHALAYVVKTRDPDGIDLFLANSLRHWNEKHTTRLIERLRDLAPQGRCSMKEALAHVLEKFDHVVQHTTPRHRHKLSISFKGPVQSKKKRGLSIYVLTDGVWQDGPPPVCEVEQPIRRAVSRLHNADQFDNMLGIQFIQFGADPTGKERLRLLDEEMERLFKIDMDVVDTTPFNGNVWKMLLGAFDRDWDDDLKTQDSKQTPEASNRYSIPVLNHPPHRPSGARDAVQSAYNEKSTYS